MTETERITNAVYDSYAAMPPEVENLGRLAAQCELEAYIRCNLVLNRPRRCGRKPMTMKIYRRYDETKTRATVPLGNGLWITAADLIHIANALPTRSRTKGYRIAGHTFLPMLGDTLAPQFPRRFDLVEYHGHTFLASWEGKDAWLPTLSLFTPTQFLALIEQYKTDPRWHQAA